MALLALVLSLWAASALIVSTGVAQAQPVVLLFHPGGFILGTPRSMDTAAEVAIANGLHPVEVDYPLGIPSRALEYSAAQARLWRDEHRTVYAYGESAGGSLAADLAERGLVSRGAVQAPVVDIPKFFDLLGLPYSREEAWGASPAAHPSLAPIHAWVPREDPDLSPDTWAWIHADPLVTGTGIPGGHLQQPHSAAAMRQGLAYLNSVLVERSGATLTITAAPRVKDNLEITRPSASTLRVANLPAGAYAGPDVYAGAGCSQTDDNSADCAASAVSLIKVLVRGQNDKVVNSTGLSSSLYGAGGADLLIGGSANDRVKGGPGADVLSGMDGNDLLRANDGASDQMIQCGRGTDKAYLDKVPEDPDSVVKGCQTKIRR